ncbi:MAG: nuclear transport factor 2 family protein [Luminiphilus sp.]|nr:nuclear transport factor 2 family protein [Luminiphilus sp.]
MRQRLILACCLVLLQINPTEANADADADREIEALYQRWRTAVESADIAGYVGVLHPDISLRPPGAPGLDGRHNYREFLGPVFETARYEIRIDQGPKVTLLGDSAIVEYDYTILRHVIPNADAELAPGALVAAQTSAHYIDVVARDSQGQWKVRLHSWQDWPEGP